jgi:manganese efflux pump family protein
MKPTGILLLAVGLAMDATAVAAARGLAVPRIRLRHVVLVATLFGGFQALMPLLGWLLGRRVGPFVEAWDHWIAFGLLVAIGGKMLWEAREDKPPPEGELFAWRAMILLAIATSVDALAAGFTLPMLDAPIAVTLATIGVTTALLSVAGLYAGRRLGSKLGKRLDVLGGLVLIGLGTKTLVEHLTV